MPRVSESCGLPKSVVGWICNHATRNYWRVADWYELDDLIQDGLLVAYKCRERYGAGVDPPHYMALVKTAFYRHIAQVLRSSRAAQEHVSRISDLAGEETELSFLDRCAGTTEPLQDVAVIMAGLPKVLRAAVGACLGSSDDDPSESQSRRLKRLAGFPMRRDFETDLRSHIWESEHLRDDTAGSLIESLSRVVELSEPLKQLIRLSFRPSDERVDSQVALAVRELVTA